MKHLTITLLALLMSMGAWAEKTKPEPEPEFDLALICFEPQFLEFLKDPEWATDETMSGIFDEYRILINTERGTNGFDVILGGLITYSIRRLKNGHYIRPEATFHKTVKVLPFTYEWVSNPLNFSTFELNRETLMLTDNNSGYIFQCELSSVSIIEAEWTSIIKQISKREEEKQKELEEEGRKVNKI